jgi:lipopolysaccharide/colanic/teichoic acid biosynthesis glycosyltransferase
LDRTEPDVYVGGIVGDTSYTKSIIKQSYNAGNISVIMDAKGSYIGGIVGCEPHLVEDCYNTGNVFATTFAGEAADAWVGGIVGYGSPANDGAINRCYSIGEVIGKTCGGVIGYKKTTTLNDCYSIVAQGVGNGSSNNVHSVTLQQLTDKSNLSNFDFESVWTIDANADYCYPTLREYSHVFGEHACTISPDNLGFDESQHWEYCVFCGTKTNTEGHTFDCVCDKTCNDCDYICEVQDATNGEWNYDDNNHWQICLTCNEKVHDEAHRYVTVESLTCSICAKSRVLASVAVTTKPTKLIYVKGEPFDTTGMTVTAYYDNGTSAVITDYMVDGYSSIVGTHEITVSYMGKTDTFTVTVNPGVPSTLTSTKYTISNNTISKITVGTTVDSLLDGLEEGSYCKVFAGILVAGKDTVVGTGMEVKIMDGTTVKASYTIVVTGDTSGDGIITITDMIAIKAHDGGPILFKQERATIHGNKFWVYKLRTMKVDAEIRSAAVEDDRITKPGKILRKFRIDELPQLLNVLKGDMSFVGPRPEMLKNVASYTQDLPEFKYRLRMKAGLTGYAQIAGKYNTTPKDKLIMDMMYIEQFSILKDIQLIFQTVIVLLKKDSTEGFGGASHQKYVFKEFRD